MNDLVFEEGLRNYVPEYMWEAMRNYYKHGVPPGDFLRNVLKNNLMGALERADHINQRNLFNYGLFLHNHMPIGSYGSAENYEAWIKAKRPKEQGK